MYKYTMSSIIYQPYTDMKSIKLVVLGETSVGKTSIVLTLTNKSFTEFQESTIGAAFLTKKVQRDKYTINFEIWDTAGQERYHSLAPMYYRNARCALVVYDITNNNSFKKAKDWVEELHNSGINNLLITLVGNKVDRESSRIVDYEKAKQYAEENELLFMETSAKTNINIIELFDNIAHEIPLEELENMNDKRNNFAVEGEIVKKKRCC